MNARLLLPALLLMGNLPVSALNVSGLVLTKTGDPLSLAIVCERGTANCMSTPASGAFHLNLTLAVNPVVPGAKGFALDFHGTGLSLRVPEAMRARLDWYDARGSRLAPTREVSLGAGVNELPAPSAGAAAGSGLRFLRLTSSNFTVTWKTVYAGSGTRAADARVDHPAPVAASLAKTAALAPAVTVTRTGYRAKTYFPQQDPDTAYILLAASSDTGLILSTTDTYTVLSLANQQLISEYTVAGCDSNGLQVTRTFQDTLAYILGGDKLLLYYAGDCVGLQLTGGSTIQGTWTTQSWAVVPPASRPADCGADPILPREPENVRVHRYIITDTAMVEEVTGESCPGDDLVNILMPGFLSVDTAVIMTKNTCRQVLFKNGTGGGATLSFAVAGDSVGTTFVFNSTTCALKQPYQTDHNPDCSRDPEGEFLDCIVASNFVPFPTTKISAARPVLPFRFSQADRLPMSRERWRSSSLFSRSFAAGRVAPLFR